MHKYVSILLAVVLVIAMAVPAGAAQTSRNVYIEDLDVSVVVPGQYDIMTRDTPDNAPVFTSRGMDVKEFHAWLEEENIYLNAQAPQGNSNFTVRAEEADGGDSYMECDYEDIEETAEYLAGYYEDEFDCDVLEAGVYDQSHVPFIYLNYKNPKFGGQNLTYFTVLNVLTEDEEVQPVKYTMTFFNDGKITADMEKKMVAFVDSFNPGVSYNFDTGVYYEVDAAWPHIVENEKDACQAFFQTSADKEPFAGVSYSAIDMMEGVDEDEYDRSEITMDEFTLEDIAGFIGLKPGDLEEVEYGDNTYFAFEMEEKDGTSKIHTTRLLHVDYGYINMFMNVEQKKGSNVDNFEAFMETVVFPE